MWLFITVLIWTTNSYAEAKRDFVLEIHEFLLNNTSPSFVKTLNYKLTRQKYLTLEIALNRYVNEIELKFKFDMLKKDNKRVNILDISIDLCKGLESAYNLPLIATIIKEVFRKGNLPKSCPIKPDVLYYIRNYTFNEEDYPRYTPIMSFQTSTEIYFDKQYQGFLKLRGRVRKR
ncbi:hypothetical protein CVS40_11475 [Lucilia cuprina]|nr:hypothetical protein CVS40_11475 [Lucilia cuprina]